MVYWSGDPKAAEETGMAGIWRAGRDWTELWRWKTPVLFGSYRYEAEENQRSDDPCLRPVHEPAEEAPASFAPLFQLDSKFDSEPLGRTNFCSWLKNGICAGDTSYYIFSSDASTRELLVAIREPWKIESLHWLLDITFSENESHFLSENAHATMNVLRKSALTVHKNYLAASGKKRSLKANMLAALIHPENLLDLFAFLWDGRD